jgi:uncharacterized damage-inducible protein DinB
MNDGLILHFRSQWRFLRGLTKDLLESMTDDDLLKSPTPVLGSWWKQFRHIGRVQENYLEAVSKRTVRFGVEGASYTGGPSKESLIRYLVELDERINSLLDGNHQAISIDWFGEKKSLSQHLLYLADHEILHHGQWIVYQKQLGGSFPKSWSVWGV